MKLHRKSRTESLQQEQNISPNKHGRGHVSRRNKSIKDTHIVERVEVTSDSVVAKAVVTLATAARRLDVYWGDGRRDVLTSQPGYVPSEQQPPGLGTATLRAGEYTFYHAYDEPADGVEFDHDLFILAMDRNDEFETFTGHVLLTPLYDVYLSDVSLRLGGPCDPPGHETSEFIVLQYVPGESTPRTWPDKWEPANDYFEENQWHLFEGSAIRKRMKGKERFRPFFKLIETDPGGSLFDDYYSFDQEITDASDVERGWLVHSTGDGGECQILYRYYTFARLYLPLPQSGPAFAP